LLPEIFPEKLEVFIRMNNKHNKIKIGRISYINVDPVYYQFDHEPMPEGIQVISQPPAVLNHMLSNNELDISSVSTSAFARNSDQWLILPDLSISCYGRVMSVLLVSGHRFEELDGKVILLTDESATAVDLLKLLFFLNNIHPVFQTGKIKSPEDLAGFAEAGLVIGDAALKHKWQNHFTHVWDLCEMWNNMTGLPFVFGLWAVRKSFAQKYPETISFVKKMLNKSKQNGLRNISMISRLSALKLGIDDELCETYFNSMNYSFGEQEFSCLKEFFKGLYALKIIKQPPDISFDNNACGVAIWCSEKQTHP